MHHKTRRKKLGEKWNIHFQHIKKPTITYRIYINDFIINIWYISEMYDFGYILVNLAYT